jgi:hypothetical protein
MMQAKRLASIVVLLGLVTVGVMAMPRDANAWWRNGVWIEPVVVVPPPVYRPRPPVVVVAPPPPPYYVAPRRVWIPAHWEGPYWVRGHWG